MVDLGSGVRVNPRGLNGGLDQKVRHEEAASCSCLSFEQGLQECYGDSMRSSKSLLADVNSTPAAIWCVQITLPVILHG